MGDELILAGLAGEGENGQDVAEPAGEQDTGAEGAEELDGEDAGASGTSGGDGGDGVDGEGEPGEMTPEQRRANAAKRREREKTAEAAATQTRVDTIYANMGQVNPYTGAPILTEAEFLAYQQAYKAEQAAARRQTAEDQLAAAGIPKAALEQLIAEHPAVKAAAQAAELSRATAGQAALERELAAITAIDPTIKTAEDLAAMPGAGVFADMVRRGYRLSDAFKLARYDDLSGKRAAAAKQQALNHAAGKAHLTATKPQGKGGVDVPAEVMEMYRILMPGLKESEYLDHYAKQTKKG